MMRFTLTNVTDCLEIRGNSNIDRVDASRRPYILRRTGLSTSQ